MRPITKSLLAIALGGVTAVTLLPVFQATAEDQPKPTEPRFAPIEVEPVKSRAEGRIVPIGGSVVPYREVTLTAQFPGRVEFIAGKEGARFETEAVLVRLDVDEMLAQRRAAEAEVRNAEASISNAEVQYQRELQYPNRQRQGGMFPMMNNMPFMNNTSEVERRADLHDYRTRIERSKASFLQARSRLEEIDAKIDDAKGIAPFEGVVLDKFVNVGDTVQPGQPLISFGDLRYLQVQAEIPVRLASRLVPGSLLRARLDAAEKRELDVKIAQIFPKADPVRHTVRVKFHLPTGTRAAAGMYAEVLIPDEGGAIKRDTPVLPASAIIDRAGLPYVYVQNPSGRRELRLLRLGEEVADRVVVLTGLRVGEEVIVNPRAAGLR